MIQLIRAGRGMVARFGNGSVRISTYTLKARLGAQVELTQVRRQEIGSSAEKEDIIPESNKVVLDFASIESLDIFLEKLQELRSDFLNEIGG